MATVKNPFRFTLASLSPPEDYADLSFRAVLLTVVQSRVFLIYLSSIFPMLCLHARELLTGDNQKAKAKLDTWVSKSSPSIMDCTMPQARVYSIFFGTTPGFPNWEREISVTPASSESSPHCLTGFDPGPVADTLR